MSRGPRLASGLFGGPRNLASGLFGGPESPIERACQTRYPAWTLYARALSGNRQDADAAVRRAVARAASKGEFATETDAHHAVLTAIRSSALRADPRSRDFIPSVLNRLHEDPAATTAEVMSRARGLTRTHKRLVELVFLGRRSVSIDEAARLLKMTPTKLEASVGRVLTILSDAPDGRASHDHVPLRELIAFVKGALSGDEARAWNREARACQTCGNRLGVMMALKATAAESTRPPRIPHSAKRTAIGAAATSGLVGLAFLVDLLMPNPWAEHATREPVPQWFHDFFYGGDRASGESETSRGLELLVASELDEAIAVLQEIIDEGEDLEASAYLGVAYYLDDDFSRHTVRLLEAGTSSHRAGRLARWYLANTLLMRRDPGGARAHLEALAGVHDFFGRAAEQLLDDLDAPVSDATAA